MKRLILIVMVGLWLPAVAFGVTIVVSPDGPLTIQGAIDLAEPGDVVELLDGVYTGTGNRDLTFSGKAITVRSQSEDPTACIIDCQGSDSEHHRGFLFDQGEGNDSLLHGITIRNGNAPWSGGIYCLDGFPTIRKCVFLNNVGSEGAAICTQGDCQISDCYFADNHSQFNGGAISACCMYGYPGPTVLRCTFVNNSATDYGGGFRT